MRKKLDNPMSEKVTVRFNRADIEALKKIASYNKISTPKLIRGLILGRINVLLEQVH